MNFLYAVVIKSKFVLNAVVFSQSLDVINGTITL